MATKGISKDSARRNKMRWIVKIFACFLAILISLAFTQSANAENSIHLKSWCTITVPDFIPDFSNWRSRFTPIFTHPSFFIFYVEAINPDNPSDFLILYIAHEIKNDGSETNIIIAIGKSLILENGDFSPPRVAADQKYLHAGIPSFRFTEVPTFPELDSLIAIKTAGGSKS